MRLTERVPSRYVPARARELSESLMWFLLGRFGRRIVVRSTVDAVASFDNTFYIAQIVRNFVQLQFLEMADERIAGSRRGRPRAYWHAGESWRLGSVAGGSNGWRLPRGGQADGPTRCMVERCHSQAGGAARGEAAATPHAERRPGT